MPLLVNVSRRCGGGAQTAHTPSARHRWDRWRRPQLQRCSSAGAAISQTGQDHPCNHCSSRCCCSCCTKQVPQCLSTSCRRAPSQRADTGASGSGHASCSRKRHAHSAG